MQKKYSRKRNRKTRRKQQTAIIIGTCIAALSFSAVALLTLSGGNLKPEKTESKPQNTVSPEVSSVISVPSQPEVSSEPAVSSQAVVPPPEKKPEVKAPVKITVKKEEIQKELTKEEIKQTEDLKKQSDEIAATSENIVVTVEKPITDFEGLTNRKQRLDVKYLPQNPELPTGCEITALTTVLNFYGYDVSKVTMARDYLAKQAAPADWTKVFVGDPTDPHSFGCYAQPINDAANLYFVDNGVRHVAINKSGADFDDILKEVDEGRPVVLWGTSELAQPRKTIKWTVDGKEMQWISPEHCYVLIGYDVDNKIAVISDPQRGIVEYDLDTVKSRYEAIAKQCVFIRENPYYTPEDDTAVDAGSDDTTGENTSSEDTSGENTSSEDTTSEETSTNEDN